MPQPVPISDEIRDQVVQLARDGVSRNEISRRTGVSATSVSRIAKRAGVTFEANVQRTELATATRAAQQRAERVEQAQGLLDDLAAGRGRLVAAENTRQWFDVTRGLHALAMAHARLVQTEQQLADGGDKAEEARSMIGQLAAGIRAMYDEQQADDVDGVPADG